MAIEITVPELGESVLEATVSRWLKKEGDFVNVGEVLVELETDKVNLEVGAKGAGVLQKIEAAEGADVKVGDVLGRIDEKAGEQKADKQKAEQPQAAEQKAEEPKIEDQKAERQEAEKKQPARKDGQQAERQVCSTGQSGCGTIGARQECGYQQNHRHGNGRTRDKSRCGDVPARATGRKAEGRSTETVTRREST